ncbi:MAG: GNAT family N-acetyltransferase [Gammaproteobacteria bacterium]|nr:GNAT family N-acetyltransferase [Gammaproteobacteria bacterium]
MHIALATSEVDIRRCYPVMVQLRPHLSEPQFLEQVRHQMNDNYRLVYLEDDSVICSLAGFRVTEMLAFGKMLYVDDLITVDNARSKGYGGKLFGWLVGHAKSNGCKELQLDSGVHRFAAHRFYLTKRMEISSHHFSLKLDQPT